MKSIKALLVVIIMAFTAMPTGCASVPKAKPELQNKALSFTPPPEMAAIYLIRPFNLYGAAARYDVILDSNEVGTLAPSTYIFGAVQPGSHVLRFKVSALGHSALSGTSTFKAEAGKVHFLKISPVFGPQACKVEQVSEAKGLKMINAYEQSAKSDLALPLTRTASSGNTATVRALIEHGENVNSEDSNGMTALMWAALKGNVEMTETLIQHGANVNHKNKLGVTPLMCSGTGGKVVIAEMLLAAGAEINSRDNNGFTAFSQACQSGHGDVAAYFYEKGADPVVPDKWVEMNGKVHHILGDYFLSLDDSDKAREYYRKAQDYYKRTIESCKDEVSTIQLKQVGLWILGAVAVGGLDALGSAASSQGNRQLAQISGMKYAQQTHTGIQGYSSYMTKYNQAYFPTYNTSNLNPLNPPSGNASLNEKKLYAEAKVRQFEALQTLMGKVLGCFDGNLNGADLHRCIEGKTKEAKE